MAFLVFEGLDGSGKSTLINALTKELKGRAISCLLTREPGGTPLAEEIRKVLLRKGDEVPHARTEVLLYEASRAQHVERVIQPALKAGKWVLCDRFTASSVAFQSYARGLKRSDIDWLNAYATGDLKPELTVLLDLPVEESLRRLAHRQQETGQSEDRFEAEKLAFHQAVRDGYLAQAKQESQAWFVLDARQSREELFSRLLAELKRRAWLAS